MILTGAELIANKKMFNTTPTQLHSFAQAFVAAGEKILSLSFIQCLIRKEIICFASPKGEDTSKFILKNDAL